MTISQGRVDPGKLLSGTSRDCLDRGGHFRAPSLGHLHADASAHYGHAEAILERRYTVMMRAYEEHPDRFTRQPKNKSLPGTVWINRPNRSSVPELVPAD